MSFLDNLYNIQYLNGANNLFQIFTDFIWPILLGILTYIAVDRLGEWKKRRDYSRLGVAIIESLQEEVNTGINIMNKALSVANSDDKPLSDLSGSSPPNKSWNGMTTIPDEVLLRIIVTSGKKKFSGLQPRECRIHCKNYFEHMIENYNGTLNITFKKAEQGEDWKQPIRGLLADTDGHYVQATQRVNEMLENIKELLEKNSKSLFPK